MKGLVTGEPNTFHANDRVNQFQATGPARQDYGSAIQGAIQNGQNNYAAQGSFIDALRAQANGTGPSVAQGLLSQQTDANNRNAASMIASQRGMNPGLAAKLISDQQAQQQQQSAGQGAVLRSQEMLNNQGLLAQALQAQGNQNLGVLGTAAGAEQGQNALGMQAQQINANVAQGNQQAGLTADQINAGVSAGNAAFQGNLLGGAINGAAAVAAGAAHGAMVPGKAAVSGDSPKNDTVPAMLSPGEVVIPRSIAQAEDAPEKAAEFVRAIRRSKGGSTAPDYGKVLAKVRELEALCRGGMAA